MFILQAMEHPRNLRPRRRMKPWVGPWLRSIRTVSVDEIAKRLERDQPYVSRLETGDSSIPADDLPIILKAYRATAEQFAEKVAEQKVSRGKAA